VAIGTYSFIPPIEGVDLEGVFSAKSLPDVINKRLPKKKRC